MARRARRSGRDEAARRPPRFDCADPAYREWRIDEVTAGGRSLAVASKQGVPAHGELDPSAALLLDHLEVGPADTVYDLRCGTGVVGAWAARVAAEGRVRMFDRNLLSAEAARRTLEANGIHNAEVAFAEGAAGMPEASADVVVVRQPEGKIPSLQLLWDAWQLLRPGGRCYLAGGNDEGVRPALKHMEALFGNTTVLGYRGGHRVGVATRAGDHLARPRAFDLPWLDHDRFHEFDVACRGGDYRVHSRPGVFSWDRLDRGSLALIETMAVPLGAEILEIGCGYGLVGVAAARLSGSARVMMVDVDAGAIRSAVRTAAANGVADRCDVLPGDVAGAVLDRRFDLVVTNPPFHVGKAIDLNVPAQFIRDAAAVLRPGGSLYLVANRTLPYERWIAACFGGYTVALDGPEFKVLSATTPGAAG